MNNCVYSYKSRNTRELNTFERIIKRAELALDVYESGDVLMMHQRNLSHRGSKERSLPYSHFWICIDSIVKRSVGTGEARRSALQSALTYLVKTGYLAMDISTRGHTVYFLTGKHQTPEGQQQLKRIE